MKFSGVTLTCDDVPALGRYYAQVLNCQPSGSDAHLEFSLDGMGIAIFSRKGMEEMAPGCTQAAGSGGVVLVIEVSDVDGEYARLQALGVDMVKPPATYPWGARAFWFRDPVGNLVDFYSRVA